jgi:probable rRNA maturation factor
LFSITVIVFDSKPEKTSQRSLETFAREAQKLAGAKGEISVLLTNSRHMRELNRRFRGKDRATDVLSFPRVDGGDIAICLEIARQNADRYEHSVSQELKILLLHGMLHVAGYDHETDNGEMAEREVTLRSRLKLPTTLIGRSEKHGQPVEVRGSSPKKRRSLLRRRRVR